MLSNHQQEVLQYILDKLIELVEINKDIRNNIIKQETKQQIIENENEVLYPKKINKNKTK